MTTERDIAGHFGVLKALMVEKAKTDLHKPMNEKERKQDREDMATAIEAGFFILETVVTDLHRLADALEIQAKFPLNKADPS